MSDINTAIILAGGKGSRMSEIFPDIPKVLISVKEKTILERQIEKLISAGMKTIIISVCHLADSIDDFLEGLTFDGANIYTIRERTPLGTGGAIKNILLNTQMEKALVINGDTLNDFNYEDIVIEHKNKHSENTIGVLKLDNGPDFGGVDIKENQVIQFIEKGNESLPYTNTGIYVLSVEAFNHTHMGSFSLEEDILPFLKNGELSSFEFHGKFWDIGTKERLEVAQREIS
jgi:NDP-sugar pyrophosphorylase family protein